MNELLAPVDFLYGKFSQIRYSESEKSAVDWLMGQIQRQALGNVELTELKLQIEEKIKKENNRL
jgi:glutamyl-tRNA(Gln) amidotransferase subunit E